MPGHNRLIALIAFTCIVVTVTPIVAQEKNEYGFDDEIPPPAVQRARAVPLAQINKNYPAILRAKPLEEEVGDDELRKLQKSRYNSAVAAVLAAMLVYEEGLGQSSSSLESVTKATTHLTEAALDIESDPEKRIKILEEVLAIQTQREGVVDERTHGGVDHASAFHHVRCERLAAEIALMKARRARKGDEPLVAKDEENFGIDRAVLPLAKRPITRAVPRQHSALPKIVLAAPLAEEASDDELRKLQKARYNSAITEVSACMVIYETGVSQGAQSLMAVLRAAVDVTDAALDMESDPRKRIAILEDALAVHSCREQVVEGRLHGGVGNQYEYHHARCERLAAEIRLIKSRRALKVEEPFGDEDEEDFEIDRADPPTVKHPNARVAPRNGEVDQEKPTPWKPQAVRAALREDKSFPKIVRGDLLVDELGDDDLRKLQKSRYNSAIAEVTACMLIYEEGQGSRSSSIDNLTRATTHLTDAALDLESDARKRVTVLEDVRELYVWLENRTAEMIGNGVDNATLSHRSRSERLAADIRLLKARRALEVAQPFTAPDRTRFGIDRAAPVTSEFSKANEERPKRRSVVEIVRAEPLKEEAGDDELRKLQKAHHNAAVAEMSACVLIYEEGLGQGSNALELAMQSAIRVTEARLDMETNTQERIKILEVQLAVFKLREDEMEGRAKAGVDNMSLFHRACYDRLGCEIELLRAKRALTPKRGRKK